MEDSKKGAGARDISDLKARLGLSKGGAAPAPAPGGPVVTPAGVQKVPAPVPAPPGFGPPPSAAAPAAPAVDPRRDPFGAVAPAAPPGYYGYAPLPGSDDGIAATPISQPKPWGKIAAVAGAGFAILMMGLAVGRIYAARVNMNMTIDQAMDLKAEVDLMSKTLNTINDMMNASQAAAKGQPDIELAAKLGELNLQKPDRDKHLFKTNYFFFENLTIDRLFNYYNDTLILYEVIAQHAKRTEADKEAIESYVKSGAAKGDANYGVTLDTTGAIGLAHVVEIGSPVCPTEGETDCSAADLKGFKYRTDSGGQWFTKPVKGAPSAVIFPIQKTPLFATIASGSPDIVAARDHLRRMAQIRLLTAKLFGEQKELLTKLEQESTRKKVRPAILF